MAADELTRRAREMVFDAVGNAPQRRLDEPSSEETRSVPAIATIDGNVRTITPRSMTLRYKRRLYEVPCDRPAIDDVAAFMRRSREEQGVTLLGRDVFERIRAERMSIPAFDKLICCLLELHGLLPRAPGVRR